MGSSNKCTPKVIIAFYIVSFLLHLPASPANTIPTAEDVNTLSQKARQTTDTFMQKSFQLRMAYEYSGKFLTRRDKENLHRLVKVASDQLQAIAKRQKELKQRIEDYQGDDWDDRYGSTGLWRKSVGDLYRTTFCKCEIDFYLALASGQPQRNEILRKILSQIDSTFSHILSDAVKLLKIKTLILLAETESQYKSQAEKVFSSPDMIYPGMPCEFYIRGQIQKIKFSGKIKPRQLNELVDYFFKADCPDDIELVLSLASLQRKFNRPEGLEKILSLWPQTEDFIGSLVLSDLSHRFAEGQLDKHALQQISILEAELAVQAAWKNKAKDYELLLRSMTGNEKFQTPLIFYVTAVAISESSPTEAVNLLIKASKLQQRRKSARLETSASKIAEQAAKMAYNLFAEDLLNCQLARESFENYCTMAGEKIDEELEYLYSIVLNDCGRTKKSKELLQKIANRPAGYWRNRAKLDLIVQAIKQEHKAGQQQSSEVLEQLRKLILNCHGQGKKNNKLRMEAITIYCQSLLELKNEVSAQSVLNILAEAGTTRGINLNLFKAQALQQLGRLDESAHYMLLAIQADSGSLADEVMELLSEVADTIDKLELQADDFDKTIHNCKKLAKFSHKSINDLQSGLLLAEISILAADKDKEKLAEAEKLLNNIARDGDANNVNLLRCRARLLTEQARFDRAAGLWAKICKIRKSQMPEATRQSWKWWRAKFYELYCWAKWPQTQKEDVLHNIDVLENTFTDIPPLWAEKLGSLKKGN